MNKVIAFVVIAPMLCLLLIKGVAFFEQDTKQRYLKDLADSVAEEVRITGKISPERFEAFVNQINKLGRFEPKGENPDAMKGIILRKGYFSDGSVQGVTRYYPGEQLYKNDYFMIWLKSSVPTNFSIISNLGISTDDTENIYYTVKAECRVEYVDVYP